jgi:LCP family protein required for cell wall assembly
MFDELDDNEPFNPSRSFRNAVIRRSRSARRRRTALRLGGATCALALVPAAFALYEYHRLDDIRRITIPSVGDGFPIEPPDPAAVETSVAPDDSVTASSATDGATGTSVAVQEQLTDATTFLIVGVDARADQPEIGSRGDTIMLLRVDPSRQTMHLLSVPRDLWVDIPGRSSPNRINTAAKTNDPQDLVAVLETELGISVDHYIQIDFDAFKDLVDLADGVQLQSNIALRDTHTGLDVPAGRCVTLDGTEALALVRSRHTQYFNGTKWVEDPRSDFGRIERQQVFLGILAAGLLDDLDDPASIHDFVSVAARSLVVDRGLTSKELVTSAWTLRNIGLGHLQTATVQADPQVVDNQSVLVPSDQQFADAASFLVDGLPADTSATASTTGDTTATPPASEPTSPVLSACAP